MSERELLVDTVTNLFARHAPLLGRSSLTDIELRDKLWIEAERADLIRVALPDSRGGAGGSLADMCAVLRAASRFAPPIPLAETQLAAWLVTEAGLSMPAGPLTIGPTSFDPLVCLASREPGLITATVQRVPFATVAGWLLLLIQRDQRTEVALIDLSRARVLARESLSGDGRGTVILEDFVPDKIVESPISYMEFLARGALARSQQIAGALSRALELAVEYSAAREQFGRPIAKFQAVQHLLAQLAAETVAATMVAEAAADMAESGLLVEAAAIAKSRTGIAASATAIAHQVHGAIGVTEEHPLHLFTRRIWQWRDDFGADVEWSIRLGREIALRGGTDLWPRVASMS